MAVQKIVVLNPKGGSGKTTIATNLASFYALREQHPALMDFDAQGSSMRWVQMRSETRPPIHGIAVYEQRPGVTRSFQLRVPADCRCVIVDTPAALEGHRLQDVTRGADAVIVPVLPSDIDIHAAARCIADLLRIAKIRRSDDRIGVVANRVQRKRTYQALVRFLDRLSIPIVATLRDSQSYLYAAESGLGIHELDSPRARADVAQWHSLTSWLDAHPAPAFNAVAQA
ncbi:MAG: AAA family ATPase [Gammaproteobacteria bacterium]